MTAATTLSFSLSALLPIRAAQEHEIWAVWPIPLGAIGAEAHRAHPWPMQGRGAPIAPQVRGRADPGVLGALASWGYRVHRVGAAAYVHSPDDRVHLILGVWPRRSTAPVWANRLGRPSAGYLRRLDRVTRAAHDPLVGSDLPWYRWPSPAPYRFERAIADPWAEYVERVEAHDRAIRASRGLVGAAR